MLWTSHLIIQWMRYTRFEFKFQIKFEFKQRRRKIKQKKKRKEEGPAAGSACLARKPALHRAQASPTHVTKRPAQQASPARAHARAPFCFPLLPLPPDPTRQPLPITVPSSSPRRHPLLTESRPRRQAWAWVHANHLALLPWRRAHATPASTTLAHDTI